jgi:N-acylneuraminate cytidylyltransferase
MGRITAVIPARGGSKGLPGKNIMPIHGKPLIIWSIEQAMASGKVDRVIVSTDCMEIAEISKKAGAEILGLRPKILAEDTTPTEPVLIHAMTEWIHAGDEDVVMLLQPTSPLRLPGSIDAAIDCFYKNQADSLLSACQNHSFFWKDIQAPQALYDYKHRPRRQDIHSDDRQYRENGSIYMTKFNVLLAERNRLGGKIAIFLMQECESLEIDSEVDFLMVEQLMRKNIS